MEDNTIEGVRKKFKNRTLPEVIDSVTEALGKLNNSEGSDEESVIEGFVKGRANMPEDGNAAAQPVIDFEDENGQDGEKALEYSRTLKIDFSPDDVDFWFTQIETEMFTCQIKSQWMKRVVLVKNLPAKIQSDVKSLLVLKQTEVPANIYKQIKKELLRIHAPQKEDRFKKALGRVLTGLPSQLGQQLVNDICDKGVKLSCGCCVKSVFTLWSLQLPLNVRSQVADMEFNANTYNNVFQSADRIFLSTKTTDISAGVAAISDLSGAGSGGSSNPSSQQAEVAAVRTAKPQQGQAGNRNRNRRGGGSGGGGQSRGGGQSSSKGQGQGRGPRHSSGPPSSCCDNHYRWGADSWFCLAPLSCPWKDKIGTRPEKKN